MSNFTEEITTEFNFPNITIWKLLRDGNHYGYKIMPNENYVMYNITEENYDIDEETGQEIPVTHYYTVCYTPLTYPLGEDTFPWRAVLRSSVDENYIFNVPDNEHEVM